ncbi:bacteriophage baseplate assembly protein W [Burkholderia pseudomallei]|uniref:GPW/gp25 family protein n=1 Tax=Burkholderia pseudomallei TaxID=28450 RepID=UPI000F2498CC|nr:GPW/gp25 family protein [Burkholderia pseudomallei]VBI29039.1 bacteriophage baseplate assembly protein W [Burkholderia pseudomallei]
MIGMNAQTGRYVEGVDHLRQSIGVIFSTPLRTRVKRPLFGSDLPDQIDAPGNQGVLTQVYAAVATALMRWEPRLTLTRVSIDQDAITSGEFAAGTLPVIVEGYTTVRGASVDFKTSVSVEGIGA